MGNKILGTLITLTIGIILVGSLLVPTITSTSDAQSTVFENTTNASGSYTINGTEDYTIYNVNGRNWVINGETVTINIGGIPLITTDVFRFVKSDTNGRYMQLFDENGESINGGGSADSYLYKIVYTASTNTCVFTKYTDLTETEVSVTYTYSCSHVIEYDPNGDYTAISTGGESSVTYYVNDVDQIVCGGAYTTGTLDTAYFSKGTTVSLGNSSYTATATATTVANDDYEDLLVGSAYTVTVTSGDTSETFTPYTVFVPKEITAHTPLNNTISGLLSVIGVLFVISLVVIGIYAFLRPKD